MKHTKVLLFGLLTLLLAGSVSCTRKTEEYSKFALQIPEPYRAHASSKAGAQSIPNAFLMHIVINVHATPSGGGIVAQHQWSARQHDGNGNEYFVPHPGTIELQVPNGSNRLVQFMGAYALLDDNGDPKPGGYIFTYDDKTITLDGKDASVTITPVAMGGAGQEGNLSGRYLTSANEGPTGPVYTYIKPPISGRPLLKLMESSMYSGFFNLFYVDNGFFVYYLPEQKMTLFGESGFTTSGASPTVVPSASLLKIASPEFYSWSPNWNYDPELREAGTAYIGFFKQPGSTLDLSGKVTYFPSSTQSIDYAYKTCTTMGCTDSLLWVGLSSDSNNARAIAGGSTGSCSGAFDTCMGFDPKIIGNFGFNELLGFRGPYKQFKIDSASHDYGHFNTVHIRPFNSSTVRLSWKYVHDTNVFAGAGAITGSTVFWSTSPIVKETLEELRHGGFNDGLPCSRVGEFGSLVSGQYVDKTANPKDIYDIAGISSSDYANFSAVVCPTRRVAGLPDRLFDYGVMPYTSQLMYSGGGPVGYIQVVHASSLQTFAAGTTCQPYFVRLKNMDNSNYTSHTSPIEVDVSKNNFSSGGAEAMLYTTSNDCDTPPGGAGTVSVTFSAGQYEKQVWLRRDSGTEVGNINAWTASMGPYFEQGEYPYGFVSSSTPDGGELFQVMSATAQDRCYPFYIVLKNGSDYSVNTSASTSVTVAMRHTSDTSPTSGEVRIFDSSDCSGTFGNDTLTISMPAYQVMRRLSFKPLVSGASGRQIKISSPSPSWSALSGPINFGTNNVTKYTLKTMDNDGSQHNQDQCVEAYLSAYNELNAEVSVPTARVVSLTAPTDTLLYSFMSDCASDGVSTTSVSFSQFNSTSERFKIKTSATCSGVGTSINFDYSDGTISTTGTGAPQAANLCYP